MKKSIKLKNENYIDSTGIVHNKKLLSDILETKYNLITDGEPVKAGYQVNGKDVWVKRVDTGALPNATTKSIRHGLDLASIQIDDYRGRAFKGTIYITLPYVATTASWQVELIISDSNINITAGDNKSSYTNSYVDIYFIYN